MPNIKPGSKLGGFEIVRELGRGGMGVVYKAHEQSLQRVVALKILPKELVSDPAFVQRFKREARAAAQLSHPNIVHIYAVGEEDGTHYIAMEYVKGVSLRDLIREKGQLDLRRALRYTGQIAQALGAAHTVGIVHRDVKPHNVMIDTADRARVMDFGLASLENARTQLTETGTTLGTPAYMSPEQCRGASAGPLSDIFSLGVTLYEMLAGRVPFDGDSPLAIMHQVTSEDPTPVTQYNSDVPHSVWTVIQKMLARDPKDRYQNTQDLNTDLRRLFNSEPPSATMASHADPAEHPSTIDPDVSMPEFSPHSAFQPAPTQPSRRAVPARPILAGIAAVAVVALAALGTRALWSRVNSYSGGPLPERTVVFPSDRDYGELFLRDWNNALFNSFYQRPLGPARGEVIVPEGQDLLAVLDHRHKGALAAYRELGPNDVQAIRIERNYDIEPEEVQHIGHLRHLESLVVSYGNRKDVDLSVIKDMHALRELEIREFNLDLSDVAALTDMHQLERLTLWGCSISGFALQYLADKTSLRYLDLNFNPIDDTGIAYLEQLSELRTLYLAHSKLTDEGLKTLLHFPQLRFLDLSVFEGFQRGWTDEGLRNVAKLTELESLHLLNHKLTAEGLRHLAALEKLRFLHIAPYMLDQQMAGVLCSELTQVRYLQLVGPPPSVTREQLAWIGQCVHLRILEMNNESISDDMLPELSKLTFLEELRILSTPLSGDGMKTLRTALPNTTIHK